ncbi:MAG: hypothetical protein KGR24_05685 [Planctomycetes bacterium]|nr:hypothetical protein [Planctomycetota bacterium]
MTRTSDWLGGLREFVRTQRLATPLRSTAASPAAEAAERSIIGGSLATRLADLSAVREARRALSRAVHDPAIVITTSAVGIAAATEVLASAGDLATIAGDQLEAVTELEYRLWCIRSPDEGFIHHVNMWNWIKTSVPRQRHAEFAAHPLGAGEVYWLHREGCAGAAALDRRGCHLWKWNGRHAALLQACVTERSVGPLGTTAAED